ncbi:Ig-like domain-containing protein [Bacillus dakarensis]|uniref:Ig-like domain-containing protein n=1 Tax=Robertmurraya dakarensis TaxID=1926278 RepID=UPI000982477A|nr:Ig-like domain-containing protein [Bacillus dakarensis]
MKYLQLHKIIFFFVLFVLIFIPNVNAETTTETWDAAIDVPSYKEWTIVLNSYVNPDTVNSDTVYILDSSNTKVNTAVTLGEADNIIVVEPPAEGFTPGAIYTLHVTDGVQDDEGNPLKNAVSKSFLIESDSIAEVTLQEEVVSLDPEAIVENLEPEVLESGTASEPITLTQENGMSLKIGDIIMIEPNDEFPEGYARKIESIQETDGVYTAETSVPYLGDLISSISLNESVEVTAEDIDPASLGQGVTVSDFREYDRNVAGFVEGLQYVFDNYPLEYNQQILFLTGKIQLRNPRIEPKMEWNGIVPELDDVKFVFKATIVTQLSFSIEASKSIKTIPFKEVEIDLGKFSTPIPQLPGLTVGGHVGGVVKVSAIGGFNASITNSTYAEVGFIKNNKNVRAVREFTNTNDISHTGSGGVEVKVGLRTGLHAAYLTVRAVELNNDVGPFGNFKFIWGELVTSNEKLSCQAGEIGVFNDLSVYFPPLKGTWLKSTYTLKSYKLPLLFINNCKSVQSIEFNDPSIEIVSGETRSVKVFSKVFDYSTGFNSPIYETVTKNVKYSVSDPSVSITSTGRVRVNSLQRDKEVIITATYTKDNKTFTDDLIVKVKKDPDLPNFPSGSNVMQDKYVNSYIITNSLTRGKSIRLPIPGDYVRYDEDGNVDHFIRNTTNVYLSKGEKAIVSFKESVPSLTHDELTIEPSNTTALLNVYQVDEATTKFTNTLSHTSKLKVTSGEYGYVLYNSDGSVERFDYVDNNQNTIYVPANGYIIITSEKNKLLNIYAAASSFTFEEYGEKALEMYELPLNQTVVITSEKPNNERFKVSGTGTFDFVEYEDKSIEKVDVFDKDLSNYSWDRTYTISPNGSFIMTNRTGKVKRIYSPYKTFHFEASSQEALEEFSIEKGESFKADNLTQRTQYVKVTGNTRGYYDYVDYNSFTNHHIDSFEKDSVIYSWDKSHSIGNGGSLILTNANSDSVIAYAPSSLFKFSSHDEKALDEHTIAPKETLSTANITSRTQYLKIVGGQDLMYDYVRYSDKEAGNIRSFEYNRTAYSWDQSYSVSSGGTFDLTNSGAKNITVYSPANEFAYTESSSPILQVRKLTSGQSITIHNLTERSQSIKLTGDGMYDYIRYSNYEEGTVSGEEQNKTLSSWDQTVSVSKPGALTITNSGDGEIIVYTPVGVTVIR